MVGYIVVIPIVGYIVVVPMVGYLVVVPMVGYMVDSPLSGTTSLSSRIASSYTLLSISSSSSYSSSVQMVFFPMLLSHSLQVNCHILALNRKPKFTCTTEKVNSIFSDSFLEVVYTCCPSRCPGPRFGHLRPSEERFWCCPERACRLRAGVCFPAQAAPSFLSDRLR